MKAIRTFRGSEFDRDRLVALKAGRQVSVCLAARNEERTVGEIVRRIIGLGSLVDEVLVVDDGSTDATADIARAMGARVVRAADVLTTHKRGPGKGEALWKGLSQTSGEFVVFCDADLEDFDPCFITGLLGPLLTCETVRFVKACYERPLWGRSREGGRVNELVARPVLSLLFPHLSSLAQPLGGEYAGCREVLEKVPFVAGYGVDLALVIDLAARFGSHSLAQIELGTRIHRNKPLRELSSQSRAVLEVALARARAADVVVAECPPLADLPAVSGRGG